MRSVGFVFIAILVPTSFALAQDLSTELIERIAKEKADRRACKIAICAAAHLKKAEGNDIACSVVRTWTTQELKDQILKGRLDWPWGHAQCRADIRLERKLLSQVLAGGAVEGKIEKHSVACTLDQADGKDKYEIKFSIAPTVKFEGGKATKATLNWSDIDGAVLAKSAVWSTAALDNNLGILEGATVEAINTFFGEKCDEVKDEYPK